MLPRSRSKGQRAEALRTSGWWTIQGARGRWQAQPTLRPHAHPARIKNSVRHQVKNDVNSERIGPFLRKLVEEVILLAFALPAVAIVAVVNRDDHNPAFVVQ